MKATAGSIRNGKSVKVIMLVLIIACILPQSGCVGTMGTAMKSHQDAIGSVMEEEYIVPQKPIDRHFIGCAWSKQFGPIEDPLVSDILVRKERSFNDITQDFAYKTGFGLGGQTIPGPKAEAGISGSSQKKAQLGGVEIITPVSLADIPFEPEVPYVTEALRLANFKLKEKKSSEDRRT